MRFQLSGALLVHKLDIHTGYSPVDISNILDKILNVETLSTSDAAFDYTIQFSTNIFRTPKIPIKNEPLDDNSDEILENNRIDVPVDVMCDVSGFVKVEVPESSCFLAFEPAEVTTEELCYTCDICSATFSSCHNQFKEHMETHGDTRNKPGKHTYILLIIIKRVDISSLVLVVATYHSDLILERVYQ